MFPGYIARMKKEQQDRLVHSSNGHTAPAYSSAGGYAPRARGTFNGSYRGGPQRGAYAYGGRGAALHHPYQRPPLHGVTKFKNRTVTFNKPEVSADTSGNESISAPGSAPLSAVQSRQSSQAPPELKQLCATFTSTGTPENIATHPCLPFRVCI